jgi:hypothetical protein
MGMVSYKTKHEMVFISTTIHTSNGKFKCWVYGGADFEWIQDTFEVDVPTKEEWLKVFTSSCNSRSHRGEHQSKSTKSRNLYTTENPSTWSI